MQIRDIPTFWFLCCGPEHPRHGPLEGPWGFPDGPLGNQCFLKAPQINERWLCLGYEIIGRNLTSSVLCGFYAIIYFQGKTTKTAAFRNVG